MNALVVVDIQKEYTTPGRRFHIADIDRSLQNARHMLKIARDHAWPIVHVQHVQDGEIFNPASEFSDFVDGFAPQDGEVLAKKTNISSFTSPAFTDFVSSHARHEFLVIGYGTTMCCLATVIDGYHRGYRFAVVDDACAARGNAAFSEQSMHAHAIKMLEPFSRITTLESEQKKFSV